MCALSCPQVQRDIAEAIAQLAMFPPGKAALMQEPSMREALQHVATEGWDDEAQRHAQAALAALSDHRQPDRDAAAAGHGGSTAASEQEMRINPQKMRSEAKKECKHASNTTS